MVIGEYHVNRVRHSAPLNRRQATWDGDPGPQSRLRTNFDRPRPAVNAFNKADQAKVTAICKFVQPLRVKTLTIVDDLELQMTKLTVDTNRYFARFGVPDCACEAPLTIRTQLEREDECNGAISSKSIAISGVLFPLCRLISAT